MYVIKKGWRAIISGRVFDLYVEVMNHAKKIKLWGENDKWPLLCSRKSVGSFGSCFYNKNPDGTFDCTVVLNNLLFDYSDDQIRKVIVHEVAHAICPMQHHSAKWHQTANLLGKKWGYEIERTNSDAELCADIFKRKAQSSPYKFELYCPVCGTTWQYKRECNAVKHPEKYRCPKDKSTLKVRKI